jgi:signal transduction histidine kinase
VAESASRAKSAFLANMSHEIRTPLTPSRHGPPHAARRGQPEQAEQLSKIDTAAHHLLAVINDILDLSKIEAEQVPPRGGLLCPRKPRCQRRIHDPEKARPRACTWW